MATACLDAQLAGLLWALIDARMPILVAGPAGTDRSGLRDALLELLPPGTELRPLDPEGRALASLPDQPDRPVVLVAGDLAGAAGPGAAPASLLPPETARGAVRAAAAGHGLGATIEADSLEAVLARLGEPPIALGGDELSHLGLVIVLEPADDPPTDAAPVPVDARSGRVAAAHWMRPVARDAHGHVQRLGPAVLAAWDGRLGRWEHFAWGVMPELAMRIGRRPGELEIDAAARTELLVTLLRSDADDTVVRQAIAGYRPPRPVS